MRRAALILAPWAVLTLAWYAVHLSRVVDPALVPPPHQVAARFWELATRQRLPRDILVSTQRVVLGVACGILLAVPVGFVLGWYRQVRADLKEQYGAQRVFPTAEWRKLYADGTVTRWLQQVTDFFVKFGNIQNPVPAAQYFDPKIYLETV
jgi:ABC-type nitrate/sulfonate/bicarbonate transport system permease component